MMLTPMMMHPWMKITLLMWMTSIMIMMIALIIIIKIAKAHSTWDFEGGTCGGHEPIIDRSYGAPIFWAGRAHRGGLLGAIGWI